MNKQEFEARVGVEVDMQTYTEIEKLYMDSPLDKDAFCKKVKRDNLIVKVQQEKINTLNEIISELVKLGKAYKKQADKALDNDRDKELEKTARQKITEAEMYVYNRQLMALAETCSWARALEVIDPLNLEGWRQ